MKIRIPKTEYVEKEVYSKEYEKTIRGLKALEDLGFGVTYNESFTETGWKITASIDQNVYQGLVYKGEWEESHAYYMNPMPKWSSKLEVKQIVNELRAIIEKYGHVTVADLYDLVSMFKSTYKYVVTYTDTKYGWTNNSQIKVRRVSKKCYTIALDKPKLLN